MENETKNGLKLGGLISIVVGVIAMIVIIPTIENVMNPPRQEYELRFSTTSGYNGASITFDTKEFTWVAEYCTDSITDRDFTLIQKTDVFYIITNLVTDVVVSLNSDENIDTYTFSETSGYGIYDFSSIASISGGGTLVPVITLF